MQNEQEKGSLEGVGWLRRLRGRCWCDWFLVEIGLFESCQSPYSLDRIDFRKLVVKEVDQGDGVWRLIAMTW